MEDKYKPKGLGLKHGQTKPISVAFPPDIEELLRGMPNKSEYVRRAVKEAMLRDGFVVDDGSVKDVSITDTPQTSNESSLVDVIRDLQAKYHKLSETIETIPTSEEIASTIKRGFTPLVQGLTQMYVEVSDRIDAVEVEIDQCLELATTPQNNVLTQESVSDDSDVVGTNIPSVENNAPTAPPTEDDSLTAKQAENQPETLQDKDSASHQKSITKLQLCDVLNMTEKQITAAMNNHLYGKNGSADKMANWIAKRNPDVIYRHYKENDKKFYPQP